MAPETAADTIGRMYDLPDTILAALRSLRFGIVCCLCLLLGTFLFGAWLGLSSRAERAPAPPPAAASSTAQPLAAGPERASLERAVVQGRDLALTGLVLTALLVLIGHRGFLAVLWSLAFSAGAFAYPAFWVLIALADDPVQARLDWRWLALSGGGLLLLALCWALLVLCWALLRVPLPGRDDLSTFVEL
jgi:hypothetical protein